MNDTLEPDETHYLCACGNQNCWCAYGDPSNVLQRGKWYAEGCAQPVVLGPLAVMFLKELPNLRTRLGLPKETA